MNPRICKRPAPGSSLRLLQLRWRTGFYPTHLGTASTPPGRGCNLVAGFASSRSASVLVLLLGQLTEVACAIQSHIILVGIEAWKRVGVGGSQMHVDQACWQPSPKSSNSEEAENDQLISNKELAQKMVLAGACNRGCLRR